MVAWLRVSMSSCRARVGTYCVVTRPVGGQEEECDASRHKGGWPRPCYLGCGQVPRAFPMATVRVALPGFTLSCTYGTVPEKGRPT